MFKATTTALAVALLSYVPQASAQSYTTVQYLYGKCSMMAAVDGGYASEVESMGAAQCLGYVRGAMDAYQVQQWVRNEELFCPGINLTAGQIAELFMAWARSRPREWNRGAAEGIALALAEVCV